ncbi:unnamed protein product [Closterium sp. NIES-65]|nr:unnamed protein product [Closterium sp. NIES-65]
MEARPRPVKCSRQVREYEEVVLILALLVPAGTVTVSNRLAGFTSHVDSTGKHWGSSSSDGGGGGGRGNRSHGVAIDRGIEEEGLMLGLAVDWSKEEWGRMERSGRVGMETQGKERGEDRGEFWVRRRVGGVRRARERVGKEHAVRGRRRAGGRGKDGGVSSRGLQERRRKRGGGRGGGGEGKEGGRVRECEGVMVGEWPGVDDLAAVGALMAVRGRRVREAKRGEGGVAKENERGGDGASPFPLPFRGPHIPHHQLSQQHTSPPRLPPVQSSCAVEGPHLSHTPSAPQLGAGIDSHSLVLRMGHHTPPTRLQAYILGSHTDVWVEVGGRGGGDMHGTHEVGGGGGGGGTGRGLTKGVGEGGGRGVGRGVGRRRLLGLKGRSVAYLRADSSALVAAPPWLPVLQQLGVSRGHVGRRRGDMGAGEEDEALFLPPSLTDEARRLFNAFAHHFRCAIGAPMPAHHAASGAASTAASCAASSSTAATVERPGVVTAEAGAVEAAREAAIPIPMPRMPPHWPVLYLLLHACDKLTLFGLIRNASVHGLQRSLLLPCLPPFLPQPHARPLNALGAASAPAPTGAGIASACTSAHQPAQLLPCFLLRTPFLPFLPSPSFALPPSPMHVPSMRSELHRRPSLLVLESLLHALARTNLLSCCGGIGDPHCVPSFFPLPRPFPSPPCASPPSPMHVPSVRSELHRRPSLLVLESLLHALARTNLLSCCGGIEDLFRHLPLLLPGAGSGGRKGAVASGAGGFDAGMAGGSVAGDGGGIVERGLGKGGQERRGEEGMAQRRENTWSGAGGDTADASGNTGSTDLGRRSVNEEDYDEDEVDGRGKTGNVVEGQGAVEGAGWGDEYGDEGEDWGEGGEGEGGGEGAAGGEDDYEYDDDYYGAPIEELMSDLEHANAAHAQEVQQTDA